MGFMVKWVSFKKIKCTHSKLVNGKNNILEKYLNKFQILNVHCKEKNNLMNNQLFINICGYDVNW